LETILHLQKSPYARATKFMGPVQSPGPLPLDQP
jgi:hypothetical protein